MHHGPFAHLHDWGQALSELAELHAEGSLDGVQDGIARLIRYRSNWRLREAALQAAAAVTQPEPVLIRAILNVARDESAYTELRILATRALGELLPRRAVFVLPDGCDAQSVVEALTEQLDTPAAPVLQQARQDAIRQIEDAAVPATS